MSLSSAALVQQIEGLVSSSIGNSLPLLTAKTDTKTLAARLAALDARWQEDWAFLLDAQTLLMTIMSDAVIATPTGLNPATGLPYSSSSIYIGSHLPSGFTYGQGGIGRADGSRVTGWLHVMQSILDILSTPLGTRVMRRDYGSRLFDLIDRPMVMENVIEVYLATATALNRWEPRFKLRNVRVNDAGSDGHFAISVYGQYFPRGHLGDYTVYEEPDGVLVTL